MNTNLVRTGSIYLSILRHLLSHSVLMAMAVLTTGLTIGCSETTKDSENNRKRPKAILNEPFLPSDKLSKSDLEKEPLAKMTGVWVSEDSGTKEVLIVESKYFKDTSSFKTRLRGFDLDGLSPIPTSIFGSYWGGWANNSDTPILDPHSSTSASATINNSAEEGTYNRPEP